MKNKTAQIFGLPWWAILIIIAIVFLVLVNMGVIAAPAILKYFGSK